MSARLVGPGLLEGIEEQERTKRSDGRPASSPDQIPLIPRVRLASEVVRAGLRLVVTAGALLIAGLLGPAQAHAQNIVYFDPTSAVASVSAERITSLEYDEQLDFYDSLTPLTGLRAEASKLTARAHAVLGPPAGGWARAEGGCCGDPTHPSEIDRARAYLTAYFDAYDPQQRPSIWLRARVKGVGFVAAPLLQGTEAGWAFLVGPVVGGSYALVDGSGQIAGVTPPVIHPIFRVDGVTTGHPLTGFNSYICDSESQSCATFSGQLYTEFDQVINFQAAPGGAYFYQLQAWASRHAVAVADPIIEPHPDNPDVVVTIRGSDLAPVPAPLADMTPEDLLARGIDPGPFQRLGFFAPQEAPQDARQLAALGPAKVWVGLRNSDDVGLRLDLKAEVFVNSTINPPIGTGQLNNVSSGSSGFNSAVLTTIPLALTGGPAELDEGDQLLLRVSVRRTCFGGGHNSGTVRLWYNGQANDSGAARDAGSRFGATIDGTTADHYYLRTGSVLDTTEGLSRTFIDKAVNSSAACQNRPFTSFGTWSITP